MLKDTLLQQNIDSSMDERRERIIRYLKRIGWVGFFFFLIKGILWLVAGGVVIKYLRDLF
jgi:hypothetical protein